MRIQKKRTKNIKPLIVARFQKDNTIYLLRVAIDKPVRNGLKLDTIVTTMEGDLIRVESAI